MKIYFWIIPLLLLAMGAFFCPFWINLIVIFLILTITSWVDKSIYPKIAKNLLVLFVFMLPIFIVKIITAPQGKAVTIIFMTFYSDGLFESLDILSRVWVLSSISNLIFYKIIDVKKMEEKNIPVLNEILLSITLYQEILGGVTALVRKKKFGGIVGFIEKSYVLGKEKYGK